MCCENKEIKNGCYFDYHIFSLTSNKEINHCGQHITVELFYGHFVYYGKDPRGLSEKEGTWMCGPHRVPFRHLRFINGPFFYLKIGLDKGTLFTKC